MKLTERRWRLGAQHLSRACVIGLLALTCWSRSEIQHSTLLRESMKYPSGAVVSLQPTCKGTTLLPLVSPTAGLNAFLVSILPIPCVPPYLPKPAKPTGER